MAVIVRNDFGAVAVNKVVIERMIIEDMLGMSDVLLLCNKKGRLIKEKPTPLIDPDYYDAVDVSDKKGHVTVKIYVIVDHKSSIPAVAGRVFEKVEQDFGMLRLEKPETIQFKVRGLINREEEIVKHSEDVVRNNS